MIDPTPEQIEARNAALEAWQEGSEIRRYSEFFTSFEDGYNAALVAAAGAAPQEPQDLSIMNGWLVESVGKHTCGAGMDGYGHDPGCGYLPVLNLAELDGYPVQVDEAKLIEVIDRAQVVRERGDDGHTSVVFASGATIARAVLAHLRGGGH